MRLPPIPLLFLLALQTLIPGSGAASTITVPDDFPSIQAAIDSGSDTVLVREGTYAEAPLAWRPITLQGIGGSRPILAGLAISNPYDFPPNSWRIAGFVIESQVHITTAWPGPRGLTIEFIECTLEGGYFHNSGDTDDLRLFALSRSRIGGNSYCRAGQVVMQSDTVLASVSVGVIDSIRVQSCWFRGGAGVALEVGGEDTPGVIRECVFEDWGSAILAVNMQDFLVTFNVFRRMTNTAVAFDVCHWSECRGNVISDCGRGVYFYGYQIALFENTLLRCSDVGVYIDEADVFHAERNVIGRSGRTGVVVRGGSVATVRLLENTIYGGRGSGIVLESRIDLYDRADIQGNIVAGNTEWGLRVESAEVSVVLGCNDWYGNGLGAVDGRSPAANDLGQDPLFCDVANNDVSLFADSPLVGGVCGLIGAKGVGCAPPSLKVLNVASSRAGLEVAWEFDAASPVESWLERADQADGPWDSLGTGTSTGSNRFELLDSAVAPDRAYSYRVAWRDRGAIVHGSPSSGSWTDAGRLSSVSPNPANGEVNVDWVLAQPGATDIRVFDLAGREVAVVAKGRFPAGRHNARWDGMSAGGSPARAGWYIVRVTRGGDESSHRVLLIR